MFLHGSIYATIRVIRSKDNIRIYNPGDMMGLIDSILLSLLFSFFSSLFKEDKWLTLKIHEYRYANKRYGKRRVYIWLTLGL